MRSAFLALLLLSGCAAGSGGVAPNAQPQGWRSLITEDDRGRLRDWRSAWVRALDRARKAGHSSEIAAEGAFLDPDAALPFTPPPPGDYRCRVTKLGARSEGLLDYIAYPYFTCRIEAGEPARFVKVTGSQRQVGWLYPDERGRMVFLGTLQLADETDVIAYGRDRERNLAGVLERIGERRWRIAFPYPHYESLTDVLELVPA